MGEDSRRGQHHRSHDIFDVSSNNPSAGTGTLDKGNGGCTIRSVSRFCEFLCRWQIGPELEPVTAAERLLGMQDVAAGPNPLRNAGAEAIS